MKIKIAIHSRYLLINISPDKIVIVMNLAYYKRENFIFGLILIIVALQYILAAYS